MDSNLIVQLLKYLLLFFIVSLLNLLPEYTVRKMDVTKYLTPNVLM